MLLKGNMTVFLCLRIFLFVFCLQGEACWWTIHPASKQRSEGEKVRIGDDLILVSVSSERYLVRSNSHILIDSFRHCNMFNCALVSKLGESVIFLETFELHKEITHVHTCKQHEIIRSVFFLQHLSISNGSIQVDASFMQTLWNVQPTCSGSNVAVGQFISYI